MKGSLTKIHSKSLKNSLDLQPLTLSNQLKDSNQKISYFASLKNAYKVISPNASGSLKRIQSYKLLLQKKVNQRQAMRQSINLLKSNTNKENNLRKNKIEQIQNMKPKQNQLFQSGLDYSFSSGFHNKPEKSQLNSNFLNSEYSEYFSNNVISDSFLGSFRAAFAGYVQLYYKKMTLALQLKAKYKQSFDFLKTLLEDQNCQFQNYLDIDQLSLAIYRLIKTNDNVDFKIVDIKFGLKKALNSKNKISAHQFKQMLQIKDQQTYLSNPSKDILNMTSQKLTKAYFETFGQFYDTQIKFKKICKANQKKLMKLIVQMSINSDLNLRILAEFIYFDVQKSKKWLMLRFQQFFKSIFGDSDFSVSFFKWIKEQV